MFSNGYPKAKKPPIPSTNFCVLSGALSNHSINSFTFSRRGVSKGKSFWPILIWSTSKLDLNRSTPFLDDLDSSSANFLVYPRAFSVSLVRLRSASPPWLIRAFIPVWASTPKARAIADDFSASVHPFVDSLMRSMISGSFKAPDWNSSTVKPSSFIAAALDLEGLSNLESAPRKAVPAFSPAIPLSERRPIAADVSSIDIPKEWATGPIYSIASPISEKPADVLLAT